MESVAYWRAWGLFWHWVKGEKTGEGPTALDGPEGGTSLMMMDVDGGGGGDTTTIAPTASTTTSVSPVPASDEPESNVSTACLSWEP